jgi:hypothetical protein
VPHGAEAPHRLKTSLLVLALQVLGVLHFLTNIKEATKSVSQKIQRIICFFLSVFRPAVLRKLQKVLCFVAATETTFLQI